MTDKSVIYRGDDYGAINNYEDGTFGVELSALTQEYLITEEDRVAPPIDVVFVLDVSGSMNNYANGSSGDTRRDALVKAVNQSMEEIFAQHPENRVGIVLYSSGSWDLLDMAGNVFNYNVIYTEILAPFQLPDLEDGEWDMTLFTCTVGGRARVVVRLELI